MGAVILRQQRKAVALEGRLQYTQALANARETSQSIVENAPLGVLGVSREGTVVLANSFLTERLGPIRLGVPLREAFAKPSADGLAELKALLEVELGSGAAAGELHSVTTDAHRFHVRIVPVKNHELGVRTFALVADQSELRSLEHQLVRAEKLISVGVLSAGIAHEIGSPLLVIRGRAEQVLRSLDGGPRSDDLRMIIKHIDHIASTIRQVLDFSRRQPIERRADRARHRPGAGARAPAVEAGRPASAARAGAGGRSPPGRRRSRSATTGAGEPSSQCLRRVQGG